MAPSRATLLCAFAITLLLAGCASKATSASGPTTGASTSTTTPAVQTPSAAAAPATTAAATAAAALPSPSPPGLTPAGVVEAYFAAINTRDYTEAWSLGGDNLNQSYGTFVAGFADTAEDTIESLSATGTTVTIQFTATNTDGTTADYAGTYTVTGQAITGASISQLGGPPPETGCGAPPNPYGFNYCGGGYITNPPPDICGYFSCIENFRYGNGYMVECEDGTVSMSGGIEGACSDHDGVKQPVYSGG